MCAPCRVSFLTRVAPPQNSYCTGEAGRAANAGDQLTLPPPTRPDSPPAAGREVALRAADGEVAPPVDGEGAPPQREGSGAEDGDAAERQRDMKVTAGTAL